MELLQYSETSGRGHGRHQWRGDPPGGMAGEVQPCLPIVRVAMGLESPCKGAWAPQGDSPGGQGLWGVVPSQRGPQKTKQKKERQRESEERSGRWRRGVCPKGNEAVGPHSGVHRQVGQPAWLQSNGCSGTRVWGLTRALVRQRWWSA
jgi:hypothetical protein